MDGAESAVSEVGAATEIGASLEPLAADLRGGTQVGSYKLEEVIGRGGMGVVYRARHIHLDRRVAVKLLDLEYAGDRDYRERFLREARIAAALEHPNIVTVHDAGESDGALYMAMQYVTGTDFSRMLATSGPLAPGDALAVLSQVAAGLDHAHDRGVVHRDVKPANVLIDQHGTAFLSDFGLTKRVEQQTRLTAQGHFVGTAGYTAPEQVQGRDTDGRADVYSFACVLYEALVGQKPHARANDMATVHAHLTERAPSISERRPDLPAAIDEVVANAMAKKPEERTATCAAVVAGVREALDAAA
jgi:serine/threonine-protein kinase